MREAFLPLVLFLACARGALPQEVRAQPESSGAADSTGYTLKPVLVTATRSVQAMDRLPYAAHLLTQQDLQRAQAGLSLDEALRRVAGVVVNNRYNPSQGDRVLIRGLGSRTPFGVRGLKIILDGIPLTFADGQSQLNNLDLGSAGTIEILRGPSSSLYGNAAGGLINIQTEAAQAAPLSLQPQVLAGAHGLQKGQLKISGGAGTLSYFLNAVKLQSTGHREHAEAGSTALNAIGRRKISDRLQLTAVLNYYDAPYLLNPGSLSKSEAETAPAATRFFIKQQGAGKKIRQGQGGVTFKYQSGEADQFEATLYGLSRTLFNPIPGRIIELDRAAGGVRAVFNKRLSSGLAQWRLSLGADYEVQRDKRAEFQNAGIPPEQVEGLAPEEVLGAVRHGPLLLDQDEEVAGIGPFSEAQLQLGDAWILTAGARFDYYRLEAEDHFLADGADDSGVRHMEKLSPMLGLVYRPLPALAAYANHGTAFQIPTTTELSNQPGMRGGFNPGLQPETMRSFEIGLKGSWPQLRLEGDLAFYRFEVEDLLIPYQLENSISEEVFYRNAGQARNRGAEMRWQWEPAPGWRMALAYTWMNFKFKDFQLDQEGGAAQLAGKKIPGVPAHRIFAGAIYEHSSGIFAEINWQFTGEYFANDFNGPPPGSSKPPRDFINEAHHLADVRLGGQRDFPAFRGEIFAGVNNLFNARYNGAIVPNAAADRFFEPAPRRSWYAGMQLAFPAKRE